MTSVTSLSGYSYSTNYKSSLDKNGDGIVSADELSASRQSGGNASGSLTSATSLEDVAGSSALDKLSSLISSILLQITSGESRPPAEGEDTGDFFASLDADGDGLLTEAEFSAGKPEDVSDDQSASLFARLDADGDGALSAEELAAGRPDGPPPPPPAGEASGTEEAGGDTGLTDLLEQLKSVIDAYLQNLDDAEEEQTALLTA